MNSLHKRLVELTDAVHIDGRQQVSVSGEERTLQSPDLSTGLKYLLYHEFYVNQSVPPDQVTDESSATFLSQLASANKGTSSWDPGWRVYSIEPNGMVSVEKDDRCRRVRRGKYSSLSGQYSIGANVSLFVPVQSFNTQPGFYHMFGEQLSDEFGDSNLVRIYFNCQPSSAPDLVEFLSTQLNRYLLPFAFKCISKPEQMTRADSAVLYIARRYYPLVAGIVRGAVTSFRLRPGTPLFTKTLEPGLAAAEDPGGGHSSGLHRCHLVSVALIDAWRTGSKSVESKLRCIKDRFSDAGLNLEMPFLNAGSVDYLDEMYPDES